MRHFLEWLWSALRRTPPASRAESLDPVLGVLAPDPDDPAGWQAAVVLGGREIAFSLVGELAPHPALVQQARTIIATWPEFETTIRGFLAREASAVRPEVAADIRALVVDRISLTVAGRSPTGMVYFAGPSPDRLWRCDYIDGQPRHLGFDS